MLDPIISCLNAQVRLETWLQTKRLIIWQLLDRDNTQAAASTVSVLYTYASTLHAVRKYLKPKVHRC